jgi:GNAT superfamily N-acetyltransferase
MTPEITKRPARAADLEFLYSLLRLSLGPYVEQTYGPWDDADQRERFFAATDPANHEIIESEGQPIGCLCVIRKASEVQLKRVFLLPTHQNRGIGTRLVRELIERARADALPVRLRVFRVNPARALYARLGFQVTHETDTHVEMERKPR